MDILIVGGGGREHTVAWKLAQSKKVDKLYCAPGNGGISQIAECHDVGATDIPGMVALAKELKVDLVAVVPDDPLALGMVDALEAEGIPAGAPDKAAAVVEGSKVFAKDLMRKYGIPTAGYAVFDDVEKAQEYIRTQAYPLVVKADGLALGKGVIICQNQSEAEEALAAIMVDKKFGASGNQVVIEEFITGPEVSILAFADGKTVLPMVSAQDHKRAYDGDQGPNTGGMGTFSPAPQYTPEVAAEVDANIIRPTIEAMAAEGRPFKGVLYFGLMLTADGPKILEYNARFGDPEAQVVLPRLKTDLLDIMLAIREEKLHEITLEWREDAAVCVVLASGGYPISYQKGYPISGLDAFTGRDDLMVFHAGTRKTAGQYVTSGGRVLGVTALGDSVELAIQKAYQAVAKINWPKVHYRTDIGKKALVRMQTRPQVGIVMGSDSDLGVMDGAAAMLRKFGIPCEMIVASAHRSPEKAMAYASQAKAKGMQVIIAGAGHAAHLAGVLAAHTTLPVIGVPIDSSCLQGMDSLLSTVQMPPGIPVATVSIGKPGAKNAGILAAQMIALTDPDVAALLEAFKENMAKEVEAKSAKLAKFV